MTYASASHVPDETGTWDALCGRTCGECAHGEALHDYVGENMTPYEAEGLEGYMLCGMCARRGPVVVGCDTPACWMWAADDE